ncbi:MAG: DUF1778 domain-containing protein [Anaerolineae bacterium]|nr:DUF1778 domain-containing protein [Anaerolineae bacterium]
MPNSPLPTARLEARVPQALKEIFQQAAHLEGVTLTDFVIMSVHQAAKQTIERHQSLTLTLEQSEAFLNALTNPPAPNAALETAFKRHRDAA